MNTKQWTVLFVTLLSFDYVTANFFGQYGGLPKTYDNDGEGYYGWSEGCRCDDDLTSYLDDALKNCRNDLGKYDEGIPLKDHTLDEYEFKNGQLKNVIKFERKSPYRCSLSRKYVRVFFSIGFFKLLIRYTVSLIEDILSFLLGSAGSFIGEILGDTINLLHIILPDVYVTVVLNQRFDTNKGFEIEGLYLNKIQKISFKDKHLSEHGDSLSPFFIPVCDHVLRSAFQKQFTGVFHKHFSKVAAKRHMFYYETKSGKKYANYNEKEGKYWYGDDGDDEDFGDDDE